MQLTIQCEPCHGTGRTEAVDEYGQFDSCPACKGEGRVVATTEEQVRADSWRQLGEVLGNAQKLIPGMTVELLP